ncbi:hypothetical protein TcWFU_006186 [Taenia crassiceps]|uniref:Uncharacterized protein n=2 Tax=Taenia crassiceps TaxID=6207 RepID=A0ABR4Q391_9CEST
MGCAMNSAVSCTTNGIFVHPVQRARGNTEATPHHNNSADQQLKKSTSGQHISYPLSTLPASPHLSSQLTQITRADTSLPRLESPAEEEVVDGEEEGEDADNNCEQRLIRVDNACTRTLPQLGKSFPNRAVRRAEERRTHFTDHLEHSNLYQTSQKPTSMPRPDILPSLPPSLPPS